MGEFEIDVFFVNVDDMGMLSRGEMMWRGVLDENMVIASAEENHTYEYEVKSNHELEFAERISEIAT